MAITYTPGKPETKGQYTLLEPGTYSFTVVECKPDKTKAKDDCVRVRLKHEDGTLVFDVLMLTQRAIWKFHQFVAACGQDPESGSFDETDAIGREVTARISIEKDTTGHYSDRNKVEAYLTNEGF